MTRIAVLTPTGNGCGYPKEQGETGKTMKLLSKIAFTFAALAFIGMTSGSAFADGIVLVSPDIQKLVPPLAALNLQHSGNSSTESGGVRYTGTGDLAFVDISAGPHQHTVLFSDLGLGRANDLQIL